jgi:hypothetical protein
MGEIPGYPDSIAQKREIPDQLSGSCFLPWQDSSGCLPAVDMHGVV